MGCLRTVPSRCAWRDFAGVDGGLRDDLLVGLADLLLQILKLGVVTGQFGLELLDDRRVIFPQTQHEVA